MREVKTKGECSLSFLYFHSPRELQLTLKCRYISVREKAHRVLFYQVKREHYILEEKPQISLTLILCNLTQTELAKCRSSPNMPTLKCLFHPCAVGIRHGLCGKVCIKRQPPAVPLSVARKTQVQRQGPKQETDTEVLPSCFL